MSILNSLSKKDVKWRQIAYNICKCKSEADDIVNDMYIRMYNRNVDQWNYSYVIVVMYNIFKDNRKENKKKYDYINNTLLSGDNDLNYTYDTNGFSDYDLRLIKEISKLKESDLKLLEMNYDLAVCTIAKNLDLCRVSVHRNMKKIRKKVLGDNFERDYKNRRLKYKR